MSQIEKKTCTHKDILQIPASSYIFSKAINIEVPSIRNVLGFPLKIRTPQNEKVCMMGFSAMDYYTELNGDVWIFGTPLFYAPWQLRWIPVLIVSYPAVVKHGKWKW